MRQNVTGLSVAQLSTVAALVTGHSVTEAAFKVGGGRSTIHRRLSEEAEFVAGLNRTKQDNPDGIRAEVRDGATEAIKVVRVFLGTRSCGYTLRFEAAPMDLPNSIAPLPGTGRTDESRRCPDRDEEAGVEPLARQPAQLTRPNPPAIGARKRGNRTSVG